MTDSTNLIRLIKQIKPDEIYNLAAMSHVGVSFEMPEYVADTDGIGTLRLLEAVRILGLEKKQEFTRLLPPNYMERFKRFHKVKPRLFTPALPTQWLKCMPIGLPLITEKPMVFASNGILFNHESPIRGENICY